MDAAQIVMMPLAGTVPAAVSDSSGITPAEQPLTGDFSQILGDALKSVGPSSNLTPELFSENQESTSKAEPEASALPVTDAALQQMLSNFLPVLQPVQPQLQVEAPKELVSSPVVSAMEASVAAQTVQPDAQVLLPKVTAQVEQPQVEAQVVQKQVVQLKVEAQVEQPKFAVVVELPKVDVQPQVIQPKVEVQVVQPKVEAQVEQPKVAAQVEQPKVDAQVLQPKVAAQAEQPKVEAPVVQPKVEAQVEQPKFAVVVELPKVDVQPQVIQPKVEVQVEQPKVEAPVVQSKVEADVLQPKVEAQVVQPKVEQSKVETQGVQPKVEVTVEQTQPKQATEWWSYGRPAAAQHLSGLQAAVNPDLNKNAVVIEKSANAELFQTESAQAVVAVPVAGDALSMEMGTDGNPQGRAFSEGMLQQHSLAVSAAAQKSEVMTAEKSAENLRSALPEQVSRQLAERLSTHDFRQGKESLSLTLTPEHLGKIQMNFQMDQQNLRVEIVAENRVAREALMQQVDSLKESLARQNVTVEKFEVSTGSGKEFQQQYQQPQQQQALYSSLYDRHGASRTGTLNSNLSEGGEEYQLPEGRQYFAQNYESTFTYRA